MGTICVTSNANIFAAHFEQKFIYPLLAGKTPLYLRFVDIISTWTKTEQGQPIFLII